jgi:hypothetical protein
MTALRFYGFLTARQHRKAVGAIQMRYDEGVAGSGRKARLLRRPMSIVDDDA